jgi:hypothetical protein
VNYWQVSANLNGHDISFSVRKIGKTLTQHFQQHDNVRRLCNDSPKTPWLQLARRDLQLYKIPRAGLLAFLALDNGRQALLCILATAVPVNTLPPNYVVWLKMPLTAADSVLRMRGMDDGSVVWIMMS